jgi:TPP-dependent pyruvate/acetoin dehydrogenase alpha subunit
VDGPPDGDIRIPSVGVGMSEALVLRWLKQPGERVSEREAVVEIETDKATMELKSETNGYLGSHQVDAGTVVPVTTLLARILPRPELPPLDAAAAAPAETAINEETLAAATDEVEAVTRGAMPTQVGPEPERTPHTLSPRVHRLRARADGVVAVDAVAGVLPIDLAGFGGAELEEWLTTMLLIREFEESLDRLVLDGSIPGGVHLASGQEAVAVGAIRALRDQDVITSPHRPHHHAIAKGMTPASVMAELWGRATGCAAGLGGTMHLADFPRGHFGSNGIVGASLGIAMGAALAAKLRCSGQIVVGFFGDGALNTGRTWEFLNFAALHRLPLIALCENNQYAVETPIARSFAGESICRRAEGFGLPAEQVDGQDVCAVHRTVARARDRAARGDGPTFIEAATYRYHGHNTGEVATYRTEDEISNWRSSRDPIDRLRSGMYSAALLDDARYEELIRDTKVEIETAIAFARESPSTGFDTVAARLAGTAFDARQVVR